MFLCAVIVVVWIVNVISRDAPKWKFLSEAKAKQNEALGRI